MATIVTGGRAHRTYTVVVFIVLASLDNVAVGLVTPLTAPISASLGVGRATILATVGATYLLSALAAVGWAYVGDRSQRKPLLMIGTLIWSVGTAGTALTGSYPGFVAAQLVAAVGLGAVGSVGFSVVTDLITPGRRGLVMSFWGLSQGVGTLAGTMISGQLGNVDWRKPFYVITVIGVSATFAYLFTYNIPRGASEPQLRELVAAGVYDYRIKAADVPAILRRRTNVWLLVQGLTAQVAFGSLTLLPLLFQAKAEAIGYSQSTAIAIGSAYATLFQLGGALSIVGGLVGDRLQRRDPGGRAKVAAVGILAAIPFYVVLFLVPLHPIAPDHAGGAAVILGVLRSVVTDPLMAASFVTAVLALALTSANAPNWFAMTAEVNPPENRGTVYSLINLTNGAGRSVGTALVPALIRALERAAPPPLNYALGLAVFQVFFIPAGLAFWRASRTSPVDIDHVRRTLGERAASPADHDPGAMIGGKKWPKPHDRHAEAG